MNINEYLKTLNYQPISTLPWVEENFACQDEEPDIRQHMPRGVVLRNLLGGHSIIGNDICGRNTTGCDCCASEWTDRIDNFAHWAWIWDVKG